MNLLAEAFAALGPGPTRRELDLVADTLRAAGDEEALAAFDDDYPFDDLAALASAAGSSAFVALDLKVVITTGLPADECLIRRAEAGEP